MKYYEKKTWNNSHLFIQGSCMCIFFVDVVVALKYDNIEFKSWECN